MSIVSSFQIGKHYFQNVLYYLQKQIQWKRIDAVDLKKSLKVRKRFTAEYEKKKRP